MSNVAKHIAMIMDGNGRWAELQGKKRVFGHEAGANVVRDITTYCSKVENIERLTLYAFSTENWKRPKLEVEFLMKLLNTYLKKELPLYLDNNIRFEPIGDLSGFSKTLQKTIADIREKTSTCTGMVQSLALNYGARDELVRAIKKMNAQNLEITEDNLTNSLDCSQEIDILIRTGGDHRLSNYMLYQASYAELFFIDTLWPDFRPEHLAEILEQFSSIKRRFGGLN